MPGEINGVSGDENICEFWGKYYNAIFGSKALVPNAIPLKELSFKSSKNLNFRVSSSDVIDSVKCLKTGKAVGPDGISAESIQHSSVLVFDAIADLFNSCLAHSYLP